ncbi:MAG: 4-hydroxy-tetrahydrodipicolinate reductase [Candidatus Odinarchaeota archaeon]
MIKLLILGPMGAMGRLISNLALQDKEINVVAACDVKNIGDDLGFIAGVENSNEIIISDVNNLENTIKESNPEVAVDFTTAQATEKNSVICIKNRIRCVIGTTALSKNFLENIENLIKQYETSAVIAPNMSIGINIIFKIAPILASLLSDWDIEIIEAHHHRKADSPSGTALKIGTIIANSLNSDFENTAKYGRHRGTILRKIGAKNEIGVHAIRAGDIVGDHTILYAGPGERIELKHQAHSRMCFATGAIKAIKFIANASENKIYTMNDILQS